MRRWDLVGGGLALGASVLDLQLFVWGGLDVTPLTTTGPGQIVLVAFVVGYGALGFMTGRVWMGRQRTRADAKRIEAQLAALEESRVRLAQSEKLAAIGRLAAGIAHEVRNPLGVIRASASMVQEAFGEDTEDHRACELITDEIDRLDGLIGALLSFAKPAKMQLVSTPLSPLVRRAASLVHEAREVEVDAAVPESCVVRADPDLLTQLLLGFFMNASEAGASQVRVRAIQDGPTIALEVADDGSGIDKDNEARVFEPFFTTKDTGTGLGLSMAARIVEAHGGALELAGSSGLGRDGAGACFTIRLPVEGPRHFAEVV